MEKIISDAKLYTDIQGLEELRGKLNKDPTGVKKEVAQQFESMLMQMVMKSMRDANKAFTSDEDNNNQMDMYQDMFDKQLTLAMSNSQTGLAKMIEQNINQQQGIKSDPTITTNRPVNMLRSPVSYQPLTNNPLNAHATVNATIAAKDVYEERTPYTIKKVEKTALSTIQEAFKTPEEFVKKLWPAAKQAAGYLGINPQLLIAQAALETNWGKKIIGQGSANSSHNLFNIKADSQWDKKTNEIDTLEQKNGVLVKEKSAFRKYDSYLESFMDFVNFLKKNDRYNQAVTKTEKPKEFVQALQDAGYATDTHYADKILNIFTSHSFKNMMTHLE